MDLRELRNEDRRKWDTIRHLSLGERDTRIDKSTFTITRANYHTDPCCLKDRRGVWLMQNLVITVLSGVTAGARHLQVG
jgi:hypothetical protein